MQKSKAILFLSAAVCVAISMSSCLKATESQKTPARAYVSIMHLATLSNTPPVDIYFDAAKVSSSAWTAGTIPSAYSAVDKGYYGITFKKTASDSVVATVSPAQYDSLNFYTVFLYNEPSGAASAAMVKDDFTTLTNDKPFVRFIHASATTGSVDLYIDGSKTTYTSDRSLGDNRFGDYLNTFQPITTGYHRLDAKLSGTDSTIATLESVTFLSANAYTIILKGNKNGTGSNQLGLGVLRAAN